MIYLFIVNTNMTLTYYLLRHAGALIMRIAYGYEKQDDKLVALVNKVMEAAGLACAPSHFWVNMMPWRMPLPFF